MYVGNLSFYTTQDTLREVFEEFGTVYDCFMPEDPATGNAKGFGFITMDSEAADEAIREMDGTCELDGRLIRLNEAKPKSRSPRNTYDEEESGFDDSD